MDKKAVKDQHLYDTQKDKARFSSREEEDVWAATQTAECGKCGSVHPLSYYPGNTCGNDGFYKDGLRRRRLECETCRKKGSEGKAKAVALAKTLNIPYKAPEGTCCAKCKKPPKVGNGLVFDHCHTRDVFRGYLCDSCNRSIGVLGDNVQGLIETLNYLLKSEPTSIVQGEDGLLYIPE
jgi:Recombination endonuclease VII